MRKVSIIIPGFNEEKTIGKLLKKISTINLKKIGFRKEIIFVDDGSTDNTKSVVKKNKETIYIKQFNQGKGSAVQKGIKFSTGDIILVQDADLEYNPNDYSKMLKPFKEKKKISVFGSRYKGKSIFSYNFFSKNRQSFFAFVFNYLLSAYFFLLYRVYISDLLTGYKLYEKNFFKKLEVKTNGFETDHELTINLLKKKYKILEVPISYNPRTKQEGKKINFFDALKAISVLTKMRF